VTRWDEFYLLEFHAVLLLASHAEWLWHSLHERLLLQVLPSLLGEHLRRASPMHRPQRRYRVWFLWLWSRPWS
jgi:hypothetical protein